MGITISDVSSYISRVLFYSDILPSPERINMKFLASSFEYMMIQADGWASFFSDFGYNANSKCIPGEAPDFEPTDWEEQDLIHYLDHGNPSWAGIDYNKIPLLNESLALGYACLTCSTADKESFWAHVIRQGAIGYAGAVSVAFTSDKTYYDMLNYLYYYNYMYTTGKSFSEAYERAWFGWFLPPRLMQTYIGDPTFNLYPPYPLTEELPPYYEY